MQHLDLTAICKHLRELPLVQPSKVAFSNIGHKENPEDGFDEDIANLDINIGGVRIGSYIINTEARERNVQALKFGDDLNIRDVRNEHHLYFDCGWRILENICERESTPERRGKQRLIIALPSPLQRIERNQELYGTYTHNTILAIKYNQRETKQGRCIYPIKYSS
jgi:hypothetical protein